jgi:predicted permease
MYNNRPDEVAGAVVTSTMLSFATLPALLWFVI